MTVRDRLLILIGSFIATAGAATFVPPIAQDAAYHDFADHRAWLGVPNFGDVASNVGFAVIGLWGLKTVLGRSGRELFTDRRDRWPYLVYFAAIVFIAIGSAYYHLAPDNARLFWDRVPMTIGFMALFVAVLVDGAGNSRWIPWLLPVLVTLGVLSTVYWDWTETLGRGDLRPYVLVQFYPLIAVPLIFWLFPRCHYTSNRHILWAIVWYAVAKLLEHFDAEVFSLLGQSVSGHSLKHLAAAVSTVVVIRMLESTSSRPLRNPDCGNRAERLG